MEFLTHTHIDFMKYRKVFVWVSLLLIVVSVVELFALTGLNLGIDFAGGTQMTVALRDEVDLNRLRGILDQAGLAAPQIQRYGTPDDRMVLIKTPVVAGSEEGSGDKVIAALDQALNTGEDGFDLNQRGTPSLAELFFTEDPSALRSGDEELARERYAELAEQVLDRRKEVTLFRDLEAELFSAVELPQAVAEVLREKTRLGAFNVVQNDNVGPQIGEELKQKGIWAVALSIVGMLGYIWYRFELRFGVGAMVAVFHDFLITLGLFALLNYEFNLATIASFLTLVGYSVNDTVVIFDRVRENMRKHRRKALIEVMNESINQTLSRTILTSGTTILVVACLFFLGGEVLRGFAFVLLVGVIVGTYSSVYVASPFALLWEQYFGREAASPRKPAASKATAA
jgi:preprotein translocase subunit SecF